MSRAIAAFVTAFSFLSVHAGSDSSAIRVDTLLQTSTAWDGTTYRAYPEGKPEVAMLRITIPANTTMNWHRHAMPNVAYVVSGELTVEKQEGGVTQHFRAGQTVAETVEAFHRGVTGAQPVELLVFYAGATGLPLSHPQAK